MVSLGIEFGSNRVANSASFQDCLVGNGIICREDKIGDDLDFSGARLHPSDDLCAERLAGPCFKLGACSTGSGRDKQGVEECGLPPEHAAIAGRF